MILSKELSRVFREAGLEGLCLINGKVMFGNGKELSDADKELVAKIARDFQTSKPLSEKSTASPSPQAKPEKRGRGRPKKK